MHYIALDEAIQAVAACIGLPEFLGNETRIYERAGEQVDYESQYLAACRYSFAAGALHQCIVNASTAVRWWSMHPDTGFGMIDTGAGERGLSILVGIAMFIRREQSHFANHILSCHDAIHPSARVIDLSALHSEMAGFYAFQTVGLLESELIDLLNASGIPHRLAVHSGERGAATPGTTESGLVDHGMPACGVEEAGADRDADEVKERLLELADAIAERLRGRASHVSLNAVVKELCTEKVRKEHGQLLKTQKGYAEATWLKGRLKGWTDPKIRNRPDAK